MNNIIRNTHIQVPTCGDCSWQDSTVHRQRMAIPFISSIEIELTQAAQHLGGTLKDIMVVDIAKGNLEEGHLTVSDSLLRESRAISLHLSTLISDGEKKDIL